MEEIEKIQEFGKALLIKIQEGTPSQKIGLWAASASADFLYSPNIDKEIYQLIVNLLTMSEGSEYAHSQDELLILANYLIFYRNNEISKVFVGGTLEKSLLEKHSLKAIAKWAYTLNQDQILDEELSLILQNLELLEEKGFEHSPKDLMVLAHLLKLNTPNPYEIWRTMTRKN